MLNGQAAKHIAWGLADQRSLQPLLCGGAPRIANRLQQRSLAKPSTGLFEFAQQLLFQMPARGFFDRAPLCCYAYLFRLTLSPRSWFHRLRHVPNLRPKSAGPFLLWFRVWIHETLAVLVRDKNNWNRGKLKDHGKKRHGHN